MDDSIRLAAEKLRQELDQKVEKLKADPIMAEVLRLHTALNTLEDLLQEPHTSLAVIFGMDKSSEVQIRADEFYGLQPLEAAKKYLRKAGEARPFQEIVEAIVKGACRVSDEDTLRRSLIRSTADVAKVSEDLFGLVEFYEHVKRGKRRTTSATAEVQYVPAGEADNEQKDNGEKSEAASE